ncbi:MAG: hypothetical protein J6D23_03435 [Clostridia bacterium]|nr:hypothetical protein [Clostridia bacterium]
MKKIVVIAMSILCMLVIVSLASCGHEHSFKTEWDGDDTNHWHSCNVDGEACTEVSDKAAHTIQIKSEVSATCTQKGSKTEQCTVCGYEKTTEIEAIGHDYSEEIVAPTCTEEGYTNVTCKREGCEYSEKKNTTPALNHDLKENVVAPTCEEAGYTAITCTRCDYSETKNPTEATGHDYKEEKIEVDACKSDGKTIVTCSKCDYREEKDIVPALPHTYYKEADAEKGTHYRVSKDPTCDEAGEKMYKCMVCGRYPIDGANNIEEIPALGHDYKETVKAPDCTNGGITEVTCSRCDLYETKDPTSAVGHKYNKTETAVENEDYIVSLAPTCDTKGERTYYCTVCDELAEEADGKSEIPELGHDMKVVVEPWCGNDAQIEKMCVRCSYTTKEPSGQEIRHEYASNEPVVAPTCVDNGKFVCKNCNTEFTAYDGDEYGQATGIHSYDIIVDDVASTCSKQGYTVYGCSAGACNTTENRDFKELAAHTLSEISDRGVATCLVCNNSYIDITAEKVTESDVICLGCGNDPCTCEGTSADLEGYVEPKAPFAITAGVNLEMSEIELSTGKAPIAIGGGIIVLYSDVETSFTVTIYSSVDGEALKTFEVSGQGAMIDLYQYDTVCKVVITATNDASVSFFKAS